MGFILPNSLFTLVPLLASLATFPEDEGLPQALHRPLLVPLTPPGSSIHSMAGDTALKLTNYNL